MIKRQKIKEGEINILFIRILKLYKKDLMKSIPYASSIGSSFYAQVCTRPFIIYVVN